MLTTPAISVVMSVYNAEQYLPQAVESILQQSFGDFELIIIEDCSTDNSLKILEAYAQQDDRIKLIKKEKNKKMKGFIENLNIGLSEAKGKYIARMDADDIAHYDRFEKQFRFLEQNPEIFMVGSSINLIDENNALIRTMEAMEKDERIRQVMLNKVAMYHPVIMFRNEGVRYRENIFYCEDYDLFLRLMNQGKKFYNFKEPLLDYRILKSSISRKDGRFMRNLFVEKTRQFYREAQREGRDSYHRFSPDSLLNILNEEQKSTKEDLEFALNIAIKFGYTTVFQRLLSLYQQQFKVGMEVRVLKFLNYLPLIFSKIYFRVKEKQLWYLALPEIGGG